VGRLARAGTVTDRRDPAAEQLSASTGSGTPEAGSSAITYKAWAIFFLGDL
jgi:hypothetical protein